MEKMFISVLRAVALVCLALAVVVLGASIFKARFDLVFVSLMFMVLRWMFLRTAKDEEIRIEKRASMNKIAEEE